MFLTYENFQNSKKNIDIFIEILSDTNIIHKKELQIANKCIQTWLYFAQQDKFKQRYSQFITMILKLNCISQSFEKHKCLGSTSQNSRFRRVKVGARACLTISKLWTHTGSTCSLAFKWFECPALSHLLVQIPNSRNFFM